MKKILFFHFIVVSTYSQIPLHDLLKTCKEVSEIDISRSSRTKFYLGKDNLDEFNSNKVIELYKDLDVKPESCLVPINISNEFNVYVKIPVRLFEEKKNMITFNVFDSYLIFDKKRKCLYQIHSEVSCGSVYKKNKKILVINSYFGKLTSSILTVDTNLDVVGINN